MKKMYLYGFTAIVVMLIGSLTLFTACQNEPPNPGTVEYNVTVTQPASGGTIKAEPLKAEEGAEITLTATVNNKFRFGNFLVNTAEGRVTLDPGTGTLRTFKMPAADVSVMASFFSDDATLYTITLSQPASGGTISADKTKAAEGEIVTISAAPDTGFELDTITVIPAPADLVITGNEATFTVTRNVTVTAKFIDDRSDFTITLTQPGSGGTISASKTKAKEGETITITAKPAAGYLLDTFTVSPEPADLVVTDNTATFTLTENVSVTADFIIDLGPFNITLTQPASGGTISVDKTEAMLNDTVTISATPANAFMELDTVTVNPKPADLTVTGNTATFSITTHVTVTASFKSVTEEIQFSHAPGVYEAAFNLTVDFPMPGAVIYYTLDGVEPVPGSPRTENGITVSGSVTPGNTINVAARTSTSRSDTLLTRFYTTWSRKSNQGPASGARILTGNAYRFRAFVDSTPVSDTVIGTYLIIPGAATKYDNNPIISINAPFQPFFDLYAAADRFNPPDNSIGRQDFNYEYFALEGGSYKRQFSLPGSTSLGGSWSRDMALRTFNVHFRRGSLNGTITYPIFEGSKPEGIYRFRLWNGGNNFVGPRDWSIGGDHFRDAFVQKASSKLNVPYSEWSLAILFIDGEYWGFTQLRQQTDNAAFAEDRLGMAANNVVIMDRGAQQLPGQGWSYYIDAVEEGDTTVAGNLYSQLESFITANFSGTPSDTAVTELFSQYFNKANFIDYLIVGTFFNATDWPQNNVRFWRAITPRSDGNPNNDGLWRFTLHDLDQTCNGITWGGPGGSGGSNYADGSRFSNLINAPIGVTDGGGPPFNRVWKILNNKNFVDEFTQRALSVMDDDFAPTKTVPLYDEWLDRFTPLLTDMYERWAMDSNNNVSSPNTRNSFNLTTGNVKYFLNNRRSFYLSQLNGLRSNVGLPNL